MALRIKCPACAEEMVVGAELTGEVLLCRVCGRRLRVPGSSTPNDPPPVRTTARPVATPDREPEPDERDDPRRPDRPRSRRAARPGGRGPLFWVLLVSGVLVALTLLSCGGLFVAVGMPHWRPHESERGGFRVELPAAPRADLARVTKVQTVPGMTVEGTLLPARREDYGIIWVDLPPGRAGAPAEAVIDDTVAGFGKEPTPGRVVRQEKITVSGFPGREVVVESDRGTGVARVVVADGRLFVVIAGGPWGGADNPRVRRFLDSFEISDRNALPVAVARRKAEEQQAETRRQAEEAARAAERRRQEEETARARAEEERLARVAAFRRAGRPAPDPYAVPGLVLQAHFDDDREVWPVGAAAVSVPAGAVRGPGPRGTALYLPEKSRVVLDSLSPAVQEALADSATVSGWVKVRARPLSLIQLEGRTGGVVGHVSVGGTHAGFATWAGPTAGDDPTASGHKVTLAWERDESWHHVAAVRERRRGDEKLTLYWDGRPVTRPTHERTALVDWADVRRLLVGVGLDPPRIGAAWAGPLRADEQAYGVDEVCVHDRPLSDAEVRVLAGLDPPRPELAGRERPAAPPAAKAEAPTLALADGRLPPLSGIGFDPGRKTAWAVTSGVKGELLRLSYPDLHITARYWLRGPAGPMAFDPVENRLYVVVAARGAPLAPGMPDPKSWPRLAGAVHRYDLTTLPDGPRPTVELAPAAAARPRVGNQPEVVRGLAVTADGAWVVVGSEGVLFRLPSDFPDDAELEPAFPAGHGHPPFDAARLEAPAGADVWFRTPQAVARLDVAARQFGARVPHADANAGARTDWLLHPSATRAYATTGPGAVDEFPLGPAALPREVLSPLPGGTSAAYLGRTADGRYVFEAANGGTEGYLSVVDTAAPPRAGRPLTTTLPVVRANHHAPFWVSPDGAVLAFGTGELIHVSYPPGAAPVIPPVSPRPFRVAVAPRPRVVVPPPLALAPLPRRVGVRPLPLGRPAPPAATEIAGLRFYLPFDDAPGATVREAVSGKAVGAVTAGTPADGVRGGALRLTRAPGEGQLTQLDLTDQTALLRAAANEPFTLALWVRPQVERGLATAFTGWRPGPRPLRFDVTTGPGDDGVQVVLAEGVPGELQAVSVWTAPGPARGGWVHVAVVREPGGGVRVFVDGAEARRPRGRGRFAGEFAFETVKVVPHFADPPAALDVDELCLFGAALPADQVRRLAGLPPGEPVAPAKGFAPEPYAGGPVPAASEIPGLKYYLPFEPNDRGEVVEAVSGKAVAKAAGVAIDGPRGKAVRLQPEIAAGQKQGPAFGLDLGAPGALQAGANAPFTLAVWVRLTDPEPGLALAVQADAPPLKGQSTPVREFHLSVTKTFSNVRVNSIDAGLKGTQKPVGRPGRWVHLAVVRDARNKVRLLVDGAAVPGGSDPTDYRFPFTYARLRLAGGDPDAPPVDLDELAFYDRALTDAELKRLAGR